jgi:hypothetical protein
MPYFQGKTTPLSALFQYNHPLFGLTRFNPLTEDFTEGFQLGKAVKSQLNPFPNTSGHDQLKTHTLFHSGRQFKADLLAQPVEFR